MNVVPKLGFVAPQFACPVKLNMRDEAKALKEHKALIQSFVKRFSKTTRIAPEDLEQEASLAFIVALRSWREDGERSLESWAFKHIENALLKLADRSNTENKHRTDPPPPSDRDDARHDPADRMDLLKDDCSDPEEQLANAEQRREFVRLLTTLSVEDQRFLLEVKAAKSIENYIREKEGLPKGQRVPSDKRFRISRRVQDLQGPLVDAAKKWSA